MDTMFDRILQLPLFQGLAQEDFTAILAKVKLDFMKRKAGDVLVKSGDVCDSLVFILRGEVYATTIADDASFSIDEELPMPYLIEPQALFGMSTTYVSTYTARSEVHTVSISKSFVMTHLFRYDIFRLNFLNIISNRAQNVCRRLWTIPSINLERRIAAFILVHSERPTGKKIMHAKMEDLALILNDTRMGISKALNAMQEKGMLELHRGEIVVPEASYLKV